MRFISGIILRAGSGATPIRAAAHFISIFLINAITLNAQTAPPTIRQQQDRILPLLARLADRASLSADLTFAARAQSQAATLLWPYDGERARAIYRRAFQSLVCDDRATSKTALQHLRVELLREIAGQDARLAEELARALTAPVAGASAGCASGAFNASLTASPTQRDVERRDLLVSVALQIVERDSARAMALAQSSLAFGVSPHFSRLLLSLRAVNAERADMLFANAVGCLERSRGVDLDGLHILGEFLVSAIESGAKESVNRGVIVRFLNCALAQLEWGGPIARVEEGDVPANQGIDAEDETRIYFIGRQLGGLFARYLPDRLGQFKCKITALSAANANDRAIAPIYASHSNEIAREARAASTTTDRDLLYARAAFAWLAIGKVSRAQAAAAKVSAAATRDRVMIQIARRYNSAGHLNGAVAVARRIEEPVARASLLASLAGAALVSEDEDQAAELLDEAAGCALMARPSMRRALALIGIAGSFTAFDAERGFEVMQKAVETINEAVAQREATKAERSNPGAAGEFIAGELYGSGFEAAFRALGRADFERAWTLAEQFTARDISVLAQLAVCRGGLARP